jgi:hypothetical protein
MVYAEVTWSELKIQIHVTLRAQQAGRHGPGHALTRAGRMPAKRH